MKPGKICAVLLLLLFLMNLAFYAIGESYSLPIDNSPGPIPDPAGYISGSAYEDDSLSVTLESRKIGDSMYHIAWVKISDPSQLRTAVAGPYGSKKTAKTTDMAAENNAVVAINGDYFQYRSGGYEVRQLEVLRKTPNSKLDLMVVDEAGDFHIFKKSNKKELTSFLQDHTAVNAFTFGPALVIDGEAQTIYNSYGFAPQDRAPRVGIGQTGPLQYVLVVVDGRQEGYSRGITIKMLGEFMSGLGCLQAFNLDGGGSATLAFNGACYNSTSDKSERNISDIIYFASAVPEPNNTEEGKQE
jgi:exopolysaccharide biosynthesis protein